MDQLAAVIAKLEEEAEPEELPQTEQRRPDRKMKQCAW